MFYIKVGIRTAAYIFMVMVLSWIVVTVIQFYTPLTLVVIPITIGILVAVTMKLTDLT